MKRVLAVIFIVILASAAIATAAPGQERVDVLVGIKGANGRGAVHAHGGRIEREFSFINVAKVSLPAAAVEHLAKSSDISFVELDSQAYALEQTVPWGIESVNALSVHSQNCFGAGINVAVLDTGINLNHEDLTVWGGYDTFNTGSYADDAGHGTHVAGTIAALNNSVGVIGAAPQARLYAVKVLDSQGSGAYSNIIAGIEWAIDNNMKIINMSLGGRSTSEALEAACNAAYDAGVLIVAAAGNEGNKRGNRDTIGYPAKYASVIAVGSITSTNIRSTFSSTGATLELMAPGSTILSTTIDGAYGTMSGTSMASPHVAGVAALVWAENPGLSNVQLRAVLNDTANDMWNDSWRYGNGLVDAWDAYNVIAGN